jgi:hypothetical protein
LFGNMSGEEMVFTDLVEGEYEVTIIDIMVQNGKITKSINLI